MSLTHSTDIFALAPGADGRGQLASLRRSKQLGGGRLLASDLRVALLLMNEARYRALARVLGLTKDQANLATLVIALMLADGARQRTTQLATAMGVTAPGDMWFVAGSASEFLHAVAGPPSRENPVYATLLMLAVVSNPGRRALIHAAHRIRTSAHRVDVRFHHRYGYLVDPGHWRQRKAARREGPNAAAAPAQTSHGH